MTNSGTYMPIFVVNLRKDIEKKAHIKELCSRYKLTPEFIDAIDGSLLTTPERDAVYSKNGAFSLNGRELSASEIGCALSHRAIFKKVVDEDIEAALVFEDDVEFGRELMEFLALREKYPEAWEIILLGHHDARSNEAPTLGSLWGRVKLSAGYKLIRPCDKGYGTYAYIINQAGARKLLQRSNILKKPIDHYSGDSTCVNLYAASPVLAIVSHKMTEKYNSMSDREALYDMQSYLSSTLVTPRYKKIAVFLGIDKVLIAAVERLRVIFLMLKPLKRY